MTSAEHAGRIAAAGQATGGAAVLSHVQAKPASRVKQELYRPALIASIPEEAPSVAYPVREGIP